jgi:hypothetical protein
MLVTLRLPGLPPKKAEYAIRCVIVWARQDAKRRVKDQLKAQGLKVSHWAAKDVTILADDYFEEHREELLAKAADSATKWYGWC